MLCDSMRNGDSAHFRLEIISSNFWTRDKSSFFEWILRFRAAILELNQKYKEKCDMGVLFSFRNMHLGNFLFPKPM